MYAFTQNKRLYIIINTTDLQKFEDQPYDFRILGDQLSASWGHATEQDGNVLNFLQDKALTLSNYRFLYHYEGDDTTYADNVAYVGIQKQIFEIALEFISARDNKRSFTGYQEIQI